MTILYSMSHAGLFDEIFISLSIIVCGMCKYCVVCKREMILCNCVENCARWRDGEKSEDFGQGERLFIGDRDTRYCTIGEF